MRAAGRVRQVRHAGIAVGDLDRSLHFYRDLLRLPVQRRAVEKGPELEKILGLPGVEVETVKLGFSPESTLVELLSFRSHPVSFLKDNRTLTAGPTHLAFTVDNLQNLYAELCLTGVPFNCPPQISADGKVLLTYCQDPDGTLIELVQEL
jgi:catechol 2,3-dioxygenase-like lactoylglutathione lyase family enzyme